MKLVNCLVRQFAKAFNTLLSVAFHVVPPSCGVFGVLLLGFDLYACDDQLRKQFLLSTTVLLLTCAAR